MRGFIRYSVRRRAVRRQAMLSAFSVAALLGTDPAFAQQAAPAVEEAVVSGTRVTRDGYQAPTPVSVISMDEIQTSGTPNVADYLNTLPALSGSLSPAGTAGTGNNSPSGVNALNLRALGTSRTLTLLDGQRVVSALNTGVVDVSELPQQLISRVDVVTGGASAAYGSDALSGVVNFILYKKFTGFKGEASGGVTNYGDDRNYKVDLTYGTGFANDRGHFILSGEVSDEQGVYINNRPWNQQGYGIVVNPAYTATNGQPQNLILPHVGFSNATLGGQITCAANSNCASLRGIAFGPGGTPYNVVYGSVVGDPYMSGGTWSGDAYVRDKKGETLQPPETRQNAFSRLSYDLNDDWTVYGQANYGRVTSSSQIAPIFYLGTLTVKADNAFIPASVASQVSALGITSFPFGTVNGDLPGRGTDDERQQERLVLGTDGKVDLLGTSWAVNGYFEYGKAEFHHQVTHVINVPNYNAAIDAVKAPNGSIVCRSTLTNPNNGCVPYDLFGTGVNSQAAINYVSATGDLFQHYLETVESVNISGEPFSLWAGPVSIATGIEHREESGAGHADALEGTGTLNAEAGLPTVGQFSITEGYVETVVPLAHDMPLVKSLDFNGAIRATGYDSGPVVTWKIGLEYSPLDDLRFRGTMSRDVREPSLSDLYKPPNSAVGGINDPFNNNAVISDTQIIKGNPNLVPESAYSTGLGVVATPSFLPGFSASFDYYAINISNGIGSLTNQQILNLCYTGNQSACALVQRNMTGGVTTSYVITVAPLNLASEHASGFDIEASYQFDLQDIDPEVRGHISLRGLATHFINDTINSGVVGAIPTQNVGQNAAIAGSGDGPPHWRYQGSINYDLDPITLNLTVRGISAGVYSNTYIQCTSGCPAATVNNPTYNINHIDGATYLDLGGSYQISDSVQAFINVRNVANKDPAPVAQGGGSGFTYGNDNPELYDILGRVYRVGIRFKS